MNRNPRRLIYFVIIVFGVIGFTGCSRHGSKISVEAQLKELLAHAGNSDFARLPPSATNVAFYQWNGWFTGETYARVEMSPNDLRSFITNSWELSGTKPRDVFSPTHKHLPRSQHGKDKNGDNAYYFNGAATPEWFKPTIDGNGKEYFLWPDKYLFIDEDRNIIWINFVKG